jgi:hypothetical protein
MPQQTEPNRTNPKLKLFLLPILAPTSPGKIFQALSASFRVFQALSVCGSSHFFILLSPSPQTAAYCRFPPRKLPLGAGYCRSPPHKSAPTGTNRQ